MKNEPKSYRDLGFTDEEFLEIVDFFKELMRLDQKGKLFESFWVRIFNLLISLLIRGSNDRSGVMI